jgi:hypothetical protein
MSYNPYTGGPATEAGYGFGYGQQVCCDLDLLKDAECWRLSYQPVAGLNSINLQPDTDHIDDAIGTT